MNSDFFTADDWTHFRIVLLLAITVLLLKIFDLLSFLTKR